MTDVVKFKRKAGAKNTGITISIPHELTEWLQLKPGTVITLEPEKDDQGKHVIICRNEEKELEVSPDDRDSKTTE